MDQSLELPDGRVELPDGARLELVREGDGYASALVRREADGSIGWQARPPEGEHDAWVGVHLLGNSLTCHSWSSWLVRIDATTGTVIERLFTK